MTNIQTAGLPDGVFSNGLYKVVLSKPLKINKIVNTAPVTQHKSRIYTRAEINRSGDRFQLSMYTEKQVYHDNFTIYELKPVLDGLFGVTFQQYHAWDAEYEYSAKVSKKGKILTSKKKSTTQPRMVNFSEGIFDRQKNHIIKEGEPIAALVDMGVFTHEGKVATGMRDKYNQINRFLELLADETGPDAIHCGTTVNIVDFGCGKSYLTFLVYHYFAKMRKHNVNICGLDLDEHVVATCAAAAKKYGYCINFVQGDISKQPVPPVNGWGDAGSFNIVISLHACDTATDHALFNAIKWQADLIYAVPCCQHELRTQMKPANLSLFSGYGIIKERIASLATDAIRANLLECCGYKAQIIEFVDMEHTPKNLLIRARQRGGKGNAAAWGEVERTIEEFAFEPMLLKLLQEGGCLLR